MRRIQTLIKITFLFTMIIILLSGCRDEEVVKKIDASLILTLENLHKTNALDKNLTVLFKVNEPITDLHQTVLKNNKVKVIAHIGHIYTASLPAKKIYDLAKLKFVDHIQASKTFRPHVPDSTKPSIKIKERDNEK